MIPLLCVGDLAVVGSGADAVVGSTAEVIELVADRERLGATRLLVASASVARAVLTGPGVHVPRLWDVAEAHRILHGGWAASPSLAWAVAAGLDPATVPTAVGGDLFDFAHATHGTDHGDGDDPESPVRADGHLRPDAFDPSWASTPARLTAAAGALAELGRRQALLIAGLGARATSTAHSESAAALLCLELERDGLPVDRPTAVALIEGSAAPAPTTTPTPCAYGGPVTVRCCDTRPGGSRSTCATPPRSVTSSRRWG